MTVGLRRHSTIVTPMGCGEVLGRSRYKNRSYIDVLIGNDSYRWTIGELLEQIKPREDPADQLPAGDAWTYWLKPDQRDRLFRDHADILAVIVPTKHDPAAKPNKDGDPNRYSDAIDEAERVRRMLVDSAGRRRGEGKVWTRSTLYKKIGDYRDAKTGGLRALLHGNTKVDLDVVLETAPQLIAVIRDYHNSARGGPIRDRQVHYTNVLHELRAKGLAEPLSPVITAEKSDRDAQKVLPYDRFQRIWRVLEHGAPTGQSGKTRQSQRRRPGDTRTKHDPFEFGDILEIDATPCNFLVRGADGKYFKPHALFAVDVATRYVWMRLVPDRPTALDYRLLFFDIVCGYEWETGDPDAETIPLVPYRAFINDDEPPRVPPIIPGAVTADHGKENENHQILGLLAQLGIDVHWARTREPADKPRIESLISKYAAAEQLLTTYKGNSVANSAENAITTGLMSFEAASFIFKGWSSWYADQPHNGLRHGHFRQQLLTPHQAVEISLTRVPHWLADDPNLVFTLLPYVMVTPQADGVAIDGDRYAPHARYQEVWASSFRSGRGRRKVAFHYDPFDLRRIFYNFAGTSEWIPLYHSGADDEALVAFDDIRQEVLESFTGVRRPSKTERVSALDRLKTFLIRPTEIADAAKPPALPRYAASLPKRAEEKEVSNEWLKQATDVDLDALDAFDINDDTDDLDDFGDLY